MKKTILLFQITFLVLTLGFSQNKSLDFDRNDDKSFSPSSTSLIMSEEITMECWINTSADSPHRIILNKEGEYEIGINQGELSYAIANSTPGWVWVFTGIIIPNNTWTHIAVTYDGSIVIVYINGVQEFSEVSNGLIGDTDITRNEFTIGYRQKIIAGTPFKGKIDEVRIWNMAKTSTEVLNNYNTELVGSELNLVSYFKFDISNSSCDIKDCNSNENHGTRVGSGGSNNLPQFSTDVPTITDVACGASTSCTVLPIELIDFNGVKDIGQIKLNWKTAGEINNLGFEIQRSKDGIDWLKVHFIEGRGTTNELQNYQYEDKQPFLGINYYRLKQSDLDGSFEYSKVISVTFGNEKDIEIYPNPTNGTLNIVGIKTAEVKIIDKLGRVVKAFNTTNQKIDISELPNGIYLISVTTKKGVVTNRIIKK